MKLSLSQRDTICPAIDPISDISGHVLKAAQRLLPRPRFARLRRRGPRWALLVLLVLAIDAALAAVVWIAVDTVIGQKF